MKIEKNITMPGKKNAKYPWKEMEIGDSFVVPSDKGARFAGQAHAASKALGRAFAVRQMPDRSYRCWRIA